MLKGGPRIRTIGGGTGTFTVLSGVKHHTDDIAAIVSTADNAGSGGRLRDEIGVLPPGDFRQAALALIDDDDLSDKLREIFNHRFKNGSLAGHAAGNILYAAIQECTPGDPAEAISLFGRILRTKGTIIPVTRNSTNLCLRLPDGTVIEGEDEIGENCAGKGWFSKGVRPDLYLNPSVHINPDVDGALQSGELIVLCPGKIWSSLAPNLLADGLVDSILKARKHGANVVLVSNLMTQPGQTDNFSVIDFPRALEELVGEPFIDTVVYNTQPPSDELLKKYAVKGEVPVGYDVAELKASRYQTLGVPLLGEIFLAPKGDKLKRSFIRHDSNLVARALMRLYYS